MNVEALVKRAFLSLEDGDYAKANEILDQSLNENPENPMAYVGLLCAELKVTGESGLSNCLMPISELNNFKKAIRFGDSELAARLNGYNEAIVNRLRAEQKEREYLSILGQAEAANNIPDNTPEQCIQKAGAFSEVAGKFRAMGDYKDAQANAKGCEERVALLNALSEQRKEEAVSAKAAKKKRGRKKLRVAFITIISVVALGFGAVKALEYYESIPDKYHAAYNEALDNSDYEQAMEIYEKYAKFYDPEKRFLSGIYSIPGTKEEVYEFTLTAFAENIERMKRAEDAFEYIASGDFEKGNAMFAESDTSLYNVPYNRLKVAIPRILNDLDPVQVQFESFGFSSFIYWINSDGTVGTIAGEHDVSAWTDIVKIVDSGRNYLIGLKKDGTLILKDEQIAGVANFDLNYGLLAMVKTDGTIDYRHIGGTLTPDIHKQSGLEEAMRWSNIKNVKVLGGNLTMSISDPDALFTDEHRQIVRPDYDAPYLVALTNDGNTLVSGYNVKITYPTASEVARGIAASIQSSGWEDVAAYLQGNSSKLPGGKTKSSGKAERIPISPDSIYINFNEQLQTMYSLSLNGGKNLPVELGADGRWAVVVQQFN